MDHEKVITTNFLRGADERLRQAFAFDTIQQLVADGACELAKEAQNPTVVNEYASIYSIMGDSRLFSDSNTAATPVFSSAEQLFLCPSLRSTLTTGPGRYDISVKEGKNFAVRMKLPEDHVLQQLVPGAEELVFGALEDDRSRSDNAKIPHSIRSIGVFVTHSKGRGTVFLDIGHNFPIDPPFPGVIGQRRHSWNEHAVYADDQLNIVAVAGTDEFQPYVRLLRLDTPQGQHFLHEARERSRRLNEKSMENRR